MRERTHARARARTNTHTHACVARKDQRHPQRHTSSCATYRHFTT